MEEYVRAAVLMARQHIEIRNFSLPETGEDEGLLRVDSCGVCGFDNEAYLNGGNVVFQLPCVIGHEVAGTIATIGSRASARWGVEAGDLVVVEEYIPCGQCRSCLAGRYHLCWVRRYGAVAMDHPKTALWGGYSDYMYLDPQSIVHKVPSGTDPRLLSLTIPLSNGLEWVQDIARARSGMVVVVQGPGPIGLSCVVAARQAGVHQIIVVGTDRDQWRLEMALSFGATHVVLAGERATDEIRAITRGQLADVVINATNSPHALADSVRFAGYGATVVHSGTEQEVCETFPASEITWKLLTVRGVLGRSYRSVDAALLLLHDNQYGFEKMISHRFSVEDTKRALETASEAGPGTIHVSVGRE